MTGDVQPSPQVTGTGGGNPPPNGAPQPYHNRIADLLDDTTEGVDSVEQDAVLFVPAAPQPLVTPQVAPQAVTSVESHSAIPPVVPPAPVATAVQSSQAPPLTPVSPAVDDTLPPFLRQPPSENSDDKTTGLPGTALFGSAARPAAVKAEQIEPAQGTAAETDTLYTATMSSLPAEGTQPGLPLSHEAPILPSAALVAPSEGGEAGSHAESAATPAGLPISIKGRSDGLVIEIGKGSWSEILATLDDRLQQSASFFRNARVALDLGARATTEAELTPLLDLLKTHGLTLGSVRTSTERTFQAALALGLTSTLESADGVPVADAAPATTNTTMGAYFVYRGYLRSGHRLQRKENVLVIGDVNPGAEVSSDGDVLVWGRLRGVVHAGAKGNVRAIVAALDLEPTQLRIADVMTIGPDPRPGQPGKWFWKRSANKRPEIARIVSETISIEEWDATRPGGIVSLRRGG